MNTGEIREYIEEKVPQAFNSIFSDFAKKYHLEPIAEGSADDGNLIPIGGLQIAADSEIAGEINKYFYKTPLADINNAYCVMNLCSNGHTWPNRGTITRILSILGLSNIQMGNLTINDDNTATADILWGDAGEDLEVWTSGIDIKWKCGSNMFAGQDTCLSHGPHPLCCFKDMRFKAEFTEKQKIGTITVQFESIETFMKTLKVKELNLKHLGGGNLSILPGRKLCPDFLPVPGQVQPLQCPQFVTDNMINDILKGVQSDISDVIGVPIKTVINNYISDLTTQMCNAMPQDIRNVLCSSPQFTNYRQLCQLSTETADLYKKYLFYQMQSNSLNSKSEPLPQYDYSCYGNAKPYNL